MKKRFLVLTALALICAMILSLSACTEQPKTSEPGTNEPQTSADTTGDKVDGVTQENVAELFLPSLEAYIYYMGSGFYTVEKDSNGIARQYSIEFGNIEDNAYKVVEYDEFKPIADQMKKYMSENVYLDIMLFDGNYKETEDGLFISTTLSNLGDVYDITSIRLIGQNEDGEYLISVDTGYNYDNGISNMDGLIFETTFEDGVLVINSTKFNEDAQTDTPAESRMWIGKLDKIAGIEPRSLPINLLN